MNKSIEILQRELAFIDSRIDLIKHGKVDESKGLNLKDALMYQKDFQLAIEILKKNISK